MLTLQVMDFNFKKLGEVAQYQSVAFTRSYYGTGSIEITVDPRAKNALTLLPDCIVFPSGEPKKAFLIEDVATLTQQKLTVRGSALKGLAKRRRCVPPLSADARPYQDFGWDRFTGSAEAAYLHFALNNLISPEDTARAIPNLIAADNLNRGDTLPWQARFDLLDTLFASIGEATGVGWDIILDLARKKFVFTAWQGIDRSAGSARCLISESNGNAQNVQYKRTQSGSATTCYVGGAGEDENRFILSVGGTVAGFARRELWAEAGSVSDVDMIRLYGQNKIDAAAEKKALTAELIDSGACRYERDYNVGDTVIVGNQYASLTARITELTETYEAGARKLQATFGDAPVTVAALMQRANTAAR